MEIDENTVNVKGIESEYMHIAPEDVGIADRKWNGVSIAPKISDFRCTQ